MMNFGSFVRSRRLELGLSLRKFSEIIGMDASHWSKIERNKLPFKEDCNRLKLLANTLRIEENTEDWYKLSDYASISRKEIPEYVYGNEEILNALPVFFRTANKMKPTEEELEKIIKILREG